MKLALVAMPWCSLDQPSPALGMLTAIVRRDRPQWEVECHFPYIDIAAELGAGVYEELGRTPHLGEMLFAAELYPERKGALREHFLREVWPSAPGLQDEPAEVLFDKLQEVIGALLGGLVDSLARRYDVVGFTASCFQTFPSLAACARLKEQDCRVRTLLGGAWLTSKSAGALITELPYVDDVIVGEGELQLLEYLDRVCAGTVTERGVFHPAGGRCGDNRPVLDDLPPPDFDRFPELAEAKGPFAWAVPVEGARGCWWSRPKDGEARGCTFCSQVNIPYREKSMAVLAAEVKHQRLRYRNPRFQFGDLVMQSRDAPVLAKALGGVGPRLWWNHDVRADITPAELLSMWEAGCGEVTVGIESFSSAHLRRLAKGTTTLQNLQVMKTCFELQMYMGAVIIVEFPQTPAEEVLECAQNILDYALPYQPLIASHFGLEPGSAVYRDPEAFGLSNLRNPEVLRLVLPEDLWNRLPLYNVEFDHDREPVSWQPVKDALGRWAARHQELRAQSTRENVDFFRHSLLAYEDWGDTLEILDRRTGIDVVTLEGVWRELYLVCMEAQRIETLVRRFQGRASEEEIRGIVGELAEAKLVFVENGRCLSLATAPTPEQAAARIRAYAKPPVRRVPSLTLAPPAPSERLACASGG